MDPLNSFTQATCPDFIPARMLNEFTYCPRLGYLEFSQGEFAHNTDTLLGRLGHRRVDKRDRRSLPSPSNYLNDTSAETSPSSPLALDEISNSNASLDDHLQNDSSHSSPRSDENNTSQLDSHPVSQSEDSTQQTNKIHTRSVMLSSVEDGIIAVIDILEIEGNIATPVDYKKGRTPKNTEKSFEPERVQLCAQGLILRSAGYQCDRGFIYYIESKEKVEILFDDFLIERTRQLVRQFKEVLNSGKIPLPLVDSPKCPRCSLVGICLPDEINFLSDSDKEPKILTPNDPLESDADPDIRRLIPARDDALPLYVIKQGAIISKSGERLVIKYQGEKIDEEKFHNISQVGIFGYAQITAQALTACVSQDIPICYFSTGGYFKSITHGLSHKNVELRVLQYHHSIDKTRSLPLARQFIYGKIMNCRTQLRRNLRENTEQILARMSTLANAALTAESDESLLGIEGTAARLYFEKFSSLVRSHDSFKFEERNRRPPRDPVNALLSYLYSLLTKEFTVTLFAVGFDPMLGFLHKIRYARPALALDIAEEFRPIVADSVAMTLINTGEIRQTDFIQRAGACTLTDSGKKIVLHAYERRLDTLITHPIFKYKLSYRRIFEVQCRLLARTLLGEIEKYPNFLTR